MRVSIDFYFDEDTDGYNGSSSASRDGVEDLQTAGQFISGALRGAGFSYVEDVGFLTDDQVIIWGEQL
jgi:hypothetical protein|tara:strand:+ start:2160 stop:2363 length:204 start_codon:yes stop_codon:yes gene_type:complete